MGNVKWQASRIMVQLGATCEEVKRLGLTHFVCKNLVIWRITCVKREAARFYGVA